MFGDPKMDELWRKSELVAERLQLIADEMGRRAVARDLYGVANPARDNALATQHTQALERLLQIGEELEDAAVKAGIIPSKEIK